MFFVVVVVVVFFFAGRLTDFYHHHQFFSSGSKVPPEHVRSGGVGVHTYRRELEFSVLRPPQHRRHVRRNFIRQTPCIHSLLSLRFHAWGLTCHSHATRVVWLPLLPLLMSRRQERCTTMLSHTTRRSYWTMSLQPCSYLLSFFLLALTFRNLMLSGCDRCCRLAPLLVVVRRSFFVRGW